MCMVCGVAVNIARMYIVNGVPALAQYDKIMGSIVSCKKGFKSVAIRMEASNVVI